MKKVFWCFLGMCLGVIVFGQTAMCFPEGTLPYANGYRAGQIDAANGVMKYELVEQDDGMTTWELIDGK